MRDLSFIQKNGKIISHNEFDLFIYGGLDIDDADLSGNTFTMLFINSGNLEAVKLFCDAGANLELKNKAGKKAFDIAVDRFKEFPSEHNKKILDLISSKIIDNSFKNKLYSKS